jgi:hypothetical protein
MPDPRPRWRYVAASAALFLGFTAVWGLAWLLFGLGTCGEDSDITAAEYARLAVALTIAGAASLAADRL